jgi:tetratricopeptide (TPR) repeat protein
VGREQELSFLRSMLLECIRTPRSTGVLVLGPAGIGKSRLRREFVRRWQAQPEPEVSVEVDVIIGQADPRSHHVPYQLIRSVLRRLCLIHGNEPLDAQQLRLRRRLGQHLHVDSAERILEQLAELCGVRMPHSDFGVLESIQPVEGLSQAFISFLRAESAVHPQLWIIEEMQWADRQSIALFDEALRALGDRPLFLLALGQHESRELLPSPRCERWQELPLSGLSNKASERILRGVLSGPLDDDLISRLTTLASGNALFLEEMARTVAGGKPEVIPETVLAMLQARLFLLSAESRRVLRLASVCGESFRRSELLALLAPDIDEKSLSFSLQELLVAELIERTSEGEGEAEEEGQFRFHHWLLKDAAYSLLSAEERIRAHCLLSQHLESVGGAPAHLRQAILALQSQEDSAKNRRRRAELLVELVRVTRGQEPIEQNLSRLSQAEALLEAAKSPETAAQDELLGMHISYWLGILRIDSNERQDAIRLFESLISRSYEIHRRDGSEEPRLMLIGSMLGRIYTLQGQVGRAVWLLEKLRPLLGTDPHELDLQLLISMGFLGLALGMSGAWRRGLQICERVLEMAQAHGDPLRVSAASALLGLLFIMAGQPQRSVQIIAPGIAAAERSGSLLYLHSCCTTSAWAHSRIGEHATAQEQLALAARFGQKLGPRPQLLDWCAMIRAELAFLRGDLDAARKLCDDALRIARQCGGSFTAGIAHRILAQSLCGMDPAGFPEATRHLQSSLESLRFGQAMIEAARTEAVWGSLCLRHGQMEEAQRRLKSALAAFSKLDLQTEHDVVAAQLASLGC